MNLRQRIGRHLNYWGENYKLLPLVLLLLWASFYFVRWVLPIDSNIDDAGSIVGMLYNLVGVAFCATSAGLLQKNLFGYRNEKNNTTSASFRDDVFDACVTVFCLVFSAVLVWH